MLNILFVSSFILDENKGGVQRVTVTLAKEFVKLGNKVSYFILEKGKTQSESDILNYYLLNNNGFNDKANVDFFKQLIIDKKIDIIINQSGIEDKPLNYITDNIPKNVKLYTVHHNCISCLQVNFKNIILGSSYGKWMNYFDFPWVWRFLLKRNKKKYGFYFKNAIEKSTKLVLLSEGYKEELKVYLPTWDTPKVISIVNPVPFEVVSTALQNKENRVLYVGRIEYAQKQCDLLLPIWQSIQDKNPDWHFDVVGNGSKLKELQLKANELNIKNIHFYGFTDPRPFLLKSKIFIMASTFEGFPMVLIEAQAFGVVPIAFSSFAAVNDIISHNTNGVLIPPYDVSSYANAISDLISDNIKRETLAKNAQKSIGQFQASTVANTWLDIFKKDGIGE